MRDRPSYSVIAERADPPYLVFETLPHGRVPMAEAARLRAVVGAWRSPCI